MQKFKGKGVYGAIAVGPVSIFSRKRKTKIIRTEAEDVNAEISRFNIAKQTAMSELAEIYEKALKEVGETNARIFEIHSMMLEDEDYNESVLNIIKSQSVNAEYAVSITSENFSSMFAAMEDSYMQARAADVKDISERLINCLMLHNENMVIESPSVICSDDLTPSETVLLDKNKILAFVTAHGSSNSHTAILARTMNIPAVIGVGEEFLLSITGGDTIAVDGYKGEVYINPNNLVLEEMQSRMQESHKKKELLKKLKGKDNVTLDGRHINIFANIGGIADIGAVLANDAGGIGLFRSEFLYLEGEDYPSEERQFEAYKSVLVSMAGKKVIIRTLDVGADKQVGYFNLSKEENPALGFRAIRICLSRPDIFKTQLRALYRASVYGNLGIMFPMIASLWELKRVLEICNEVKEELKKEGIEYSDCVEVGIMIETPAAAIISEKLAPLVDFFSVGTNDLTQYTLACDRQNPYLEQFCDPHHEAVLALINYACESAHNHGAWIGICGELAADISLTKAFLKMGIDELSVSPSYVLKVRDRVRTINLASD